MSHAVAAAGAGFLLAVLWFDLMFDVQARGQGALVPADKLASISAYYRRVTTDARPMNQIVPLAMLITVAAIGVSLAADPNAWTDWLALALALSGIGLALVRTVRNAVRLGRAEDDAPTRSRIARLVLADHLYCFAAIAMTLALQLTQA